MTHPDFTQFSDTDLIEQIESLHQEAYEIWRRINTRLTIQRSNLRPLVGEKATWELQQDLLETTDRFESIISEIHRRSAI